MRAVALVGLVASLVPILVAALHLSEPTAERAGSVLARCALADALFLLDLLLERGERRAAWRPVRTREEAL